VEKGMDGRVVLLPLLTLKRKGQFDHLITVGISPLFFSSKERNESSHVRHAFLHGESETRDGEKVDDIQRQVPFGSLPLLSLYLTLFPRELRVVTCQRMNSKLHVIFFEERKKGETFHFLHEQRECKTPKLRNVE